MKNRLVRNPGSILRDVIAGLGLALAVVCGIFGVACGRESESEPARRPHTRHDIRFEGLWAEKGASDPQDLRVRISVDRLVLQSRRFGILSLRPVKELVLANTRMDIGIPGASESSSAQPIQDLFLADRLFELPGIPLNAGIVTRLTSKPLDVQIEDDSGPLFRIQARSARVGWERGHLDLVDADITSRRGQRLVSSRARWLEAGRGLALAGGWTLREGELQEQGSEALFRMLRSGRLEPAPPPPSEQR